MEAGIAALDNLGRRDLFDVGQVDSAVLPFHVREADARIAAGKLGLFFLHLRLGIDLGLNSRVLRIESGLPAAHFVQRAGGDAFVLALQVLPVEAANVVLG